MLKDIFQQLETEIRDAQAGLTVRRYKGELEESSDWNPIFPICFLRFGGYYPKLKSPENEVLDGVSHIILYVADKNINEPDGLDLLDSIMDLCDNLEFTINDVKHSVEISNEGCQLYGYYKGVDAYTIPLIIY